MQKHTTRLQKMSKGDLTLFKAQKLQNAIAQTYDLCTSMQKYIMGS